MEVRRGTVANIPEIVDLLEEYHPTSNLKEVPFVRRDLVKILEYYMRARESCPLIAVSEGKIVGILLGTLEPFFFNKRRYYATDLFFISNGGGMQLLNAFKEWAWGVRADRIIMGVSSGEDRADTFLELSGFEKTGGMYVLYKTRS